MLGLEAASWIAIVILSVGYWLQVWKIQVHKEVRDISLSYYIMLGVGFGILGITAYIEQSLIFIVKQIATFVPVVVIIFQVIYHRKDRWHDPSLPFCSNCKREVELHWKNCPYCGRPSPAASG